MIRSMTAFGNATSTSERGTIAVEVRSVNSRFLDLHFRLPDELRHLETPLREKLSGALARGKVEVRASVTRRVQADVAQLNLDALRSAADLMAAVRSIVPETAAPRLAELLAWPGVQADADDPTQWDAQVIEAAGQALAQLQEARVSEGGRLAEMMRDRAAAMQDIVEEVEAHMPRILAEYRERLGRKLHDTIMTAFPAGLQSITGAELSERLTHEATLFTLRIDVAEELSRLKSHLAELTRIIGEPQQASDTSARGARGKANGSAGKRLDFLFQEMNREANTLGSKAGALEMTRAAVDLKLLIEQLREQAQNIE
jgi:uncharacterized protein (TIGR00255 family)